MPMPSRLKDIPFEDYSQAQKEVLAKVLAARGRIPVPLKVWLQSPKLAQAIEPLSTMLNTASSLAKREWEIAVIVMAQHWGSASVLDAHCNFMRAAGSPEAVIAALQAREPPPFETDREKAVYAIATACDRGEHVSNVIFDHAEKTLGPEGLAELIAFLGYYSGIAIAMKLYSSAP
jgi:4-carboxymuconolactone decarboxylase